MREQIEKSDVRGGNAGLNSTESNLTVHRPASNWDREDEK